MTFNGQIHPFADRFPMLPEEQLQELADSIAANGQRHPILLDAEGTLIDGRNRLAACELAGVEPRFQQVEGDALDEIQMNNLDRRHLSAGQRIMGVAMGMWEKGLWNETTQRWRQGAAKEAQQVSLNSETSSRRRANDLSLAGKILAHSPDLAQQVLTGTIGLQAAADQVDKEQRRAQVIKEQMAELAEQSPDLHQRVIAGEPLPEAWAAHLARHEERIRQEKERAEYELKAADDFRQIMTMADWLKFPESREAVLAGFPRARNMMGRDDPDTIHQAGELLIAFADYIRENRA